MHFWSTASQWCLDWSWIDFATDVGLSWNCWADLTLLHGSHDKILWQRKRSNKENRSMQGPMKAQNCHIITSITFYWAKWITGKPRFKGRATKSGCKGYRFRDRIGVSFAINLSQECLGKLYLAEHYDYRWRAVVGEKPGLIIKGIIRLNVFSTGCQWEKHKSDRIENINLETWCRINWCRKGQWVESPVRRVLEGRSEDSCEPEPWRQRWSWREKGRIERPNRYKITRPGISNLQKKRNLSFSGGIQV